MKAMLYLGYCWFVRPYINPDFKRELELQIHFTKTIDFCCLITIM